MNRLPRPETFSLDRELVLFFVSDKRLRDGVSIIKGISNPALFALLQGQRMKENTGQFFTFATRYSGAKLIVRTLILYVLRERLDVSLVEITALHNIKIG